VSLRSVAGVAAGAAALVLSVVVSTVSAHGGVRRCNSVPNGSIRAAPSNWSGT